MIGRHRLEPGNRALGHAGDPVTVPAGGLPISVRVAGRIAIFLAGGATVLGLALFIYANVHIGSRRSIDAQLDGAITRGLDYLDRRDLFAIGQERGGHPPVEVWIAKKILVYEDHPGFRDDVERGWEIARSGSQRFLTSLPGEPRRPLTASDRTTINLAMKRHWTAGDESHAIFGRWIIYAMYPEFRDLIPGDFDVMMSEVWDVSNGYKLSHRVLVYRVMRALNPEDAHSLGVPRLEARARGRMYLEMLLDFRLSDLYFERLAFLLEDPDPPWVPARWAARVLRDQNDDGGWAFASSLTCEVRALAGVDCWRGPSRSHPTFLAVFALVQYRDLLRRSP
jgi:hypothetical protein